MTASVEILVIGNEVLAGNVLDSNSHWLCQQVSARGGQVQRITVLRDEPDEIKDGLLSALGRWPNLVVTCGGLGPTQDDLTVCAIARALGLGVSQNSTAYTMVQELYTHLFARGEVTTAEMLPQRAKMAQLPQGAEPLANRVGAAPGVLLQHEGVTIVALPGVPAEMKDIFAHSLLPRLTAIFPEQAYGERTIKTRVWDESILAPAVDAVASRHPQVYVKSRAQVYGSGMADYVTLAARGQDEDEVRQLLDAAEGDLRQELSQLGIETD
jgi:molybdenum cofactor synthesis domain-containing protein